MQRYITSLITFLATAEARKLSTSDCDTSERAIMGVIAENLARNDDFGLIAEEGEEDMKFINWMAKFGANYSTVEELSAKKENWIINNATIRAKNLAAKLSGRQNPAMFNHNKASAMSLSELDARLGLKIQEQNDGDRRLSDETESIDVIA